MKVNYFQLYFEMEILVNGFFLFDKLKLSMRTDKYSQMRPKKKMKNLEVHMLGLTFTSVYIAWGSVELAVLHRSSNLSSFTAVLHLRSFPDVIAFITLASLTRTEQCGGNNKFNIYQTS